MTVGLKKKKKRHIQMVYFYLTTFSTFGDQTSSVLHARHSLNH